MKSEEEIQEAIDELEEKCGPYDAALGNRIRALEWVLDQRIDDIV